MRAIDVTAKKIGGRYRYRALNRWVSYWAALIEAGDQVTYTAVLNDEVGLCGMTDGSITVDSTMMSADEAVRADVCRHIDETELPPGIPPDPEWIAACQQLRCW